MRRMLNLAVVILPIVLLAGLPALSQQEDLKNGTQGASEVTFGFYVDNASGNQSHVREYDGREFHGWGLETLDSYGYSGPFQYWFGARSLITGDEDVSLDLSVNNSLGVKLSTSALTHRYDRIPGINPYLSGIIYPEDGRPLSGINSATGAPFGDAFIELSPDTELALHRRVDNFAVRQYFGRRQAVALNADLWQEIEHGARQVRFYDSRRYSVPLGIDRSTSVSTIGTDVRVGPTSVLNYSVASTEFSDNTKPVLGGTFLDNSRFPSVKTSSNILKARSRISDKLYFTGVHTKRNRTNETATLSGSSPAVFLDDRIETESTNLGLTFLATDTLSLNGRWRSYELDNFVPPVPDATAPTNFNLSRKVDSAELGASYNGIRNAFLRFGYERRNTERTAGELHPELEGLETKTIQESSKSNIWRFGARYNPTLKLNLSGNAEIWNTDHPGYFGLPTDRTSANLNATYTVRDNFVLYGDFSTIDDRNKDVRVEDVPTLDQPDNTMTDEQKAAYQEAQELAAGQGYKNKSTTMDVGAWFGLGSKLAFDANIARVSMDASELWVIGASPGHVQNGSYVWDLPNLPAETQNYSADNNQWSLGLNYNVKPRFRVYSRFLHSDSDGRASFTTLPGDLTLPQGWVPVDVTEKRYTIGFAYDVTPADRLVFDFSTSDWKDRINPANDGRFNLWRLAWSTGF